MRRTRVMPLLLLHQNGLYKTIKFKNPKYIGDPINAIRLFNDLEVDEIAIIDIDATKNGTSPNIELIKEIASEAFMPMMIGGGVSSINDVEKILGSGVEKVLFNKLFLYNADKIREISNNFGSQSIVVSINIKKDLFGKNRLYDYTSRKFSSLKISDALLKCTELGVGEIIITYVDKDGMQDGLELKCSSNYIKETKLPIVINGGAKSIDDLKKASLLGFSGIAVGSMFVYHGATKGVLINYPSQDILNKELI